jgi:hypothetical protein
MRQGPRNFDLLMSRLHSVHALSDFDPDSKKTIRTRVMRYMIPVMTMSLNDVKELVKLIQNY